MTVVSGQLTLRRNEAKRPYGEPERISSYSDGNQLVGKCVAAYCGTASEPVTIRYHEGITAPVRKRNTRGRYMNHHTGASPCGRKHSFAARPCIALTSSLPSYSQLCRSFTHSPRPQTQLFACDFQPHLRNRGVHQTLTTTLPRRRRILMSHSR